MIPFLSFSVVFLCGTFCDVFVMRTATTRGGTRNEKSKLLILTDFHGCGSWKQTKSKGRKENDKCAQQ